MTEFAGNPVRFSTSLEMKTVSASYQALHPERSRATHHFAHALLLLAALFLALPAAAQNLSVDINQGLSRPLPIAVPAFATPSTQATPAGDTARLGNEVATVISNDLESSGLFRPLDPLAYTTDVTMPDVTAPRYPNWRTIGAQALVTGFVEARGDGSITVGCYLYDVFSQQALVRQGFNTEPGAWRRAAHKCADAVYSRLTGETGYFDSRIVYVSETGPATQRIKRLAIMDQDPDALTLTRPQP